MDETLAIIQTLGSCSYTLTAGFTLGCSYIARTHDH